ncbi:MAG: AzlD domain-containing protein [Clostridia bacterium]|nr:AzlD domain-containing protein [Clostridia bacterium]
MQINSYLLINLAVMALVTYLIRAAALILIRKKIENKFIKSFLYYIPYAVLAAMTIPAIFYSTGSVYSAILGLAVAVTVAFFEKGLVTVALSACVTVFVTELVLKLI